MDRIFKASLNEQFFKLPLKSIKIKGSANLRPPS